VIIIFLKRRDTSEPNKLHDFKANQQNLSKKLIYECVGIRVDFLEHLIILIDDGDGQ